MSESRSQTGQRLRGEIARPHGTQPKSHPAIPVFLNERVSLAEGALQLFVLNAFIFAQPMLDRLSRRATFLVVEKVGPTAMILATIVILLVIPMLLWLPQWIAQRTLGETARHRLHRATTFLLFWLFGLFCLHWLVEQTGWEVLLIPGLVYVLSAAALAYFLNRMLVRASWFRKTLAYASIGTLLFPAAFFLSPAVRGVLYPADPEDRVVVETPVPIVMVVFDGFTGMSLLNEHHEIDAIRYPNFARLGQTSHWYRNATTVHPRTSNAVPAILTGCYPRDVLPLESEYPVNLFRLIHNSRQYEMSVFEPFTRMTPRRLHEFDYQPGVLEQVSSTLKALGCVYLHATIPGDLPPGLPPIPRGWFNLPDLTNYQPDRRTGRFSFSWHEDRHLQLEHFLNCIGERDRPGFYFLHVVLPHYPWNYLPSGKHFVDELDNSRLDLGVAGGFVEDWTSDPLVVNSAWHRYLLQVQYTDRFIGQLLDRLEATGLMDECLLVVTADHGSAFVPGLSSREPVGGNVPDVLSIPLFLKLPGQTVGALHDRNVECIDIFPTLAEIIGMELPEPIDGRSILDDSIPPRLRKTYLYRWEPHVLPADFPERYRYVDRMLTLFGSGSYEDRLMSFSPRADLIGRPLEDFPIESVEGPRLSIERGSEFYDPAHPETIPCYFAGLLLNSDQYRLPVWLAIAVNGRIAAVTRTVDDPWMRDEWGVLVPESFFHLGENKVQYFELISSPGEDRLRPCRVMDISH